MRTMTLSIAILLAACQLPPPLPAPTPVVKFTGPTSLNWAGAYQGIVPCADCQGIETTLRLAENGTYELSLKYLGKSAEIFSSAGSFEWQADGVTLALTTSKAVPRFYRAEQSRLRQLDMLGEPITGAQADKYVLWKLADDPAGSSFIGAALTHLSRHQ